MWQGKRVFLTGHTGFKGSWLTLMLHRMGAQVTGFSLPGAVSTPNLFDVARLADLCTDLRGDVRDGAAVSDAIQAAKPDIVIHMAAQPLVRLGLVDPVATFDTNVMGTVHVLDAVRRTPVVQAVLIVTSDKCYDNADTGHPHAEGDAMGGRDPYSASKGAAELVTAAYIRSYFSTGTPAVTTARAGNVVGGGDWAADRLLPDLARAAARGDTLSIRAPHAIRPWQDVRDALGGYIRLIEHMMTTGSSDPAGWNFAPTGDDLTVAAVVAAFHRVTNGVPTVVFGDDAAHEVATLRLNASKAHAVLGWSARDAGSAIADAARWYAAYADSADARTLMEASL
jgi:CDP-glucose 4,6-dehydratase